MLTPLDPKQWDVTKAAHLLNRAGFGGTPEQIQALYSAGFEGAVHSVLNAPDDSQQFPKPAEVQPLNFKAKREEYRMLPEAERKEKIKMVQKEQRKDMLQLVTWWLDRMAQTPNPLRE